MHIQRSLMFGLVSALLALLTAPPARPEAQEAPAGSTYSARHKLKPYAQFLADVADRPRRVVYTPYPVSAQHGVVRGFVHVSDGTAVLSRTDLVVDASLPIVIRRALHSARSRSADRDFGRGGWRLTVEELIVRRPDGALEYTYGNGAALVLDVNGRLRSPLQAYLTDMVAVSVENPAKILVRTRTGLVKRFGGAGAGAGAVLRLAEVADGHGNSLRFEYAPSGGLAGIASSSGARVDLLRNAAGHVDRVTDSRGRAVRYGYDAAGRLASVTDLGGHEWKYQYDPVDRLIATTTPNGVEDVAFAYGDSGRVTRSRANGWRHGFEYHGLHTRVTDRHGAVTTFTAAPVGLTVGIGNSLGTTTALTLNEDGVPVSLSRNAVPVARFLQLRPGTGSGFRGHVVSPVDGQSYWIRYDGLGRVVTVASEQRGPLYEVRRYGPGLAAERIVHADDSEEGAQFDAAGELAGLFRRDGSTLRFERVGPTWRVAGDDGRRAQLQFDAYGRLERAETPDAHVLSFAYNELGLREATRTSYGALVRYQYDASGSLFHSQVSAGSQVEPAYTYVLGPEQRVDAVAATGGAATRFIYDAQDRLREVRSADDEPLLFEYDPLQRLIGVEHGDREPIEYRYAEGEVDIVGQLTARSLPVFNQQREISDFASRFEVGFTRIRAAGLGLFTDDELLNEITIAADPARWDPAAPLVRSVAALRLEALLGRDPRGIASFVTPSNRLFVPAEYWSVNCCLCYCEYRDANCVEP